MMYAIRAFQSALVAAVTVYVLACAANAAVVYHTEDPISAAGYVQDPATSEWIRADGPQVEVLVPAGQAIKFRIASPDSADEWMRDIDSWTDPYYLCDSLDCEWDYGDESSADWTSDPVHCTNPMAYYEEYPDPDPSEWPIPEVQHTYSEPGVYTATWEVSDVAVYFSQYRSGANDPVDPSGAITVIVYDPDEAASYTYERDPDTNTFTVTNSNGTSCLYTYDERYRLRQVKHLETDESNLAGAVLNYTVDGASNRTEIWFDEDAQAKTLYQYDEVNRLTQVNAMHFVYDWVGNITLNYRDHYTYDNADRITLPAVYSYYGTGSISQESGTPTITYDYNDRGLLSVVGEVQ